MDVVDFESLYLTELQELRSAEAEILEAMPAIIDRATHPQLKDAMEAHAAETRAQLKRLDRILSDHRVDPVEHRDGTMRTILAEAERWSDMIDDPDLRDAGLIASAQRVEHYEIAVYGSLATWAKQLGFYDDFESLLDILEEEKRADGLLSEVAKQVVNRDAERV